MVTGPDPASLDRSQPGYTWDFCGGDVAIDFTNTVGSRGDAPAEHFLTAGDIISWAETREVVTRAEAARVRKHAADAPADARRAVRDAVELREALYRLLYAFTEGKPGRADDLARVNDAVSSTYAAAALAREGGRFVLSTNSQRSVLDPILSRVIRAAVDLLTSGSLAQVGHCGDDTCGWLFLDTTRSRTRRWCDMRQCGNRNKVRRFRQAR